jgi:hypothetical protein
MIGAVCCNCLGRIRRENWMDFGIPLILQRDAMERWLILTRFERGLATLFGGAVVFLFMILCRAV